MIFSLKLSIKSLYWITFCMCCITILIFMSTLACFNTDPSMTLFYLILNIPVYGMSLIREHAFIYYYSVTKFTNQIGLPYFLISNIYLLNLYANFILIFLLPLFFKEIKKNPFLLFFPMATYVFVYANSFIFPVPEEFVSCLLIWPCLFIITGSTTNMRCVFLLLFSFLILKTHEIMFVFGPLLAALICIRFTKFKKIFQKIIMFISALFFLSNVYFVIYSNILPKNGRPISIAINQTLVVLFKYIYWPLWYTFIFIILAIALIINDQKYKNNFFLKVKKTLNDKNIILMANTIIILIIFLWALNNIFMKSIPSQVLTWSFYTGSVYILFLISLFIAYQLNLIIISERSKKIMVSVTSVIAVCQTFQWTQYAFDYELFMNNFILSRDTKHIIPDNAPYITYPPDQFIVPILFQASKNRRIDNIPKPIHNEMTWLASWLAKPLLENKEHLSSIKVNISESAYKKLSNEINNKK